MSYSEYPPSGSGSGSPSEYQSQDYGGGYGDSAYPEGGQGADGAPDAGEDLGYMNPKVALLRKIKGVILVVELLVMLVLIYMSVTQKMAEFEGMDSKPILPLGPILLWILVIGLFMAITGIIFKLLELRATESASQRVLLMGNAARGAATSMVVALVFFFLLFLLPTTDMVKDAITSKEDSNKEYGEETYKFKAQDEFLVTQVTQATATIQNNFPVNFGIMKKSQFENFTTVYKEYEQGNRSLDSFRYFCNQSKIEFGYNTTKITKPGATMQYGEYRIYTHVFNDGTAKIHYEIKREIQPELLTTLTTFLLIFGILDGVWMGICLGIKQKYKKQSIIQ